MYLTPDRLSIISLSVLHKLHSLQVNTFCSMEMRINVMNGVISVLFSTSILYDGSNLLIAARKGMFYDNLLLYLYPRRNFDEFRLD